MGTDDRALLLAAQNDDERAFGNLLCRHRDGLALYCLLLVGDRNTAEELLANAMLAAWRERRQAGVCTAAEIWLYRVATRECLKAMCPGSEAQ
jgi:RNA polymerase sigma-70 factor, ECF subfamily